MSCDGYLAADHDRVGPDTRPSLTRRTWPRPALRQDRLEVIRPAAGSAVEIRRLADYDAALGTGGGAA